jgi:glutathione reductase (NADPH)
MMSLFLGPAAPVLLPPLNAQKPGAKLLSSMRHLSVAHAHCVDVIPRKASDLNRRYQQIGVFDQSSSAKWPALMRFKQSFTDPVPERREESYRAADIAIIHGKASFVAEDRVKVGDREIVGQYFVIATGAMPMHLPFEGGEHVITSEEFLSLQALPKAIVFVGGGYISFEFAHIAARAGTRVTIVHRGKRPLEQFDEALVSRLLSATEQLGITVILDAAVTKIEKHEDGYRVHASNRAFLADLVVHGAGRVPNLHDLSLGNAHVDRTKRGVEVNAHLQSTSNPRVYAAGDAADSGGLPLTPTADLTGTIVATNIIEGNTQAPDFSVIPSIVFTIPSLGSVGVTQVAADKRSLSYKMHEGDMKDWYSSRRVLQPTAYYRVLVDKHSDKILGAHVIGDGTEEMINLFSMAMQLNSTASTLSRMLFAYPSHGSDIAYML